MQVKHDKSLRVGLSHLTNLAEILIKRHRAGKSITPVMWSALSQRTSEARALLDAAGPPEFDLSKNDESKNDEPTNLFLATAHSATVSRFPLRRGLKISRG